MSLDWLLKLIEEGGKDRTSMFVTLRKKLFLPHEFIDLKKKLEKLSQTRELILNMDLGDTNKNIIIPIWCSLPA